VFLQPSVSPSRSRRASRGFTLIELVVVVLIIGITAAMATPTVTKQVKERRARDAAQRVALLYSNARMRALGRGSAVLVRYVAGDASTPPTFTVLESIEGAAVASIGTGETAACAERPGLGCVTNNWGAASTTARQVAKFTPLPEISAVVSYQGANPGTLDICFTPMGRGFSTVVPGSALTPMASVPTVDVWRPTGGQGIVRTVAILPNGMARIGL
jgi:prepilin-type N-terminal cleavage/methylation domain-containing protein